MKLYTLKNNAIPIINQDRNWIHFVGIGGAGMCGIAEVLMHKGFYVTGSDIVMNEIIQRLIKLGIKVFFGHQSKNINKANVLVISSAIKLNNPEIQAAKKINIPIMQRAEVLSELMRYKYGIAVAGTHGKSTTTAMIANIYIKSGLDPTFINGGIIKSEGVQARFGSSRYVIVEADESDKSFLCLYPEVEVITNINYDHMCSYNYNIECLKESFISFLNNLPVYGYAVVCIDNPIIRQILFNINRKIITYGFSKDADLCIFNYHQHIGKSNFTILLKNNKELRINLNIPGRHNALNATAAIAVAIAEGISDANILQFMYDFQGINRRFENLGYYSLKNVNGRIGKIILIDDYGHHPNELFMTIETARVGWPNRRLVMVFQPHRFTRMQELYNNFIDVLSNVDVLIMLEIYAAGEHPIIGINSQSLCHSIYKRGKIKPIFISDKFNLLKFLIKLLKDNDLLLIQGAGTISSIVRELFVNVVMEN